MTSRNTVGQKRQRSETPGEPQTPNKRIALIQVGLNERDEILSASASLSPEAREKRKRVIQAELNSTAAPNTPSRHTQGSSRQTVTMPARPTNPVGIERHSLFPASARKTPRNAPPNKEVDEETAFWTSTSRVTQPVSGSVFSSAGHHTGTSKNIGHNEAEGSSRTVYHNSMPTPPRSSPVIEDYFGSPTSATQVSDLLRQSPNVDSSQEEPAIFGGYGWSQKEPGMPTHEHIAALRAGSVTPGPSTPSKSINTDALREILKHLPKLQDMPDEIDRLKRRLKAAEQGTQKKQERIDELETELKLLRTKWERLEKTIQSLNSHQ